MGQDANISIGYYRGPIDALLIGLENSQLKGALIELDGGADELHALIDERTAGYPELIAHNERARNGVWRLGPIMFVDRVPTMPIENDNIAAVRALLETHADPEIAFHVSVRDRDGYLLGAHDVGNNVILVSPRLPETAVEAIRAALGENLRPD
jgi:DNA-binding NarL/FixJ family response regulator